MVIYDVINMIGYYRQTNNIDPENYIDNVSKMKDN